jgi:hypothetical protein
MATKKIPQTRGSWLKSDKQAPLVVGVATLLALVGVLLGFRMQNALWLIPFLLPAAIVEVARTEGVSTRTSSWILLIVLVAEIFLIVFGVNINLAEFLGASNQLVGGYLVPLGDIKIVAPALMAVLSVILIVRTWGIYTRWLAGVIFAGSFALIYLLDPVAFQGLWQYALEEALRFIQ